VISVRAQVMHWDETYNGWMAHDGGGVSLVALYRRVTPIPLERQSVPDELRRQPHHEHVTRTRSSPVQATETTRSTGVVLRACYCIIGRRVLDDKVDHYEDCCLFISILQLMIQCELTSELSYRPVMPTFHHWQVNQQKYGLSFVSNYDACRFHSKVQRSLEHLQQQNKNGKHTHLFALITPTTIVSKLHKFKSNDVNRNSLL
jgi:hypothetical protein